MNEILLSSHSWLRWIVLLLFFAVIARSFSGYRSGRIYDALDKRWNTLLLASVHTQALLGLILYFTSDMMRNIFADFGGSMKNSDSRFWSVEHITVMLISVILRRSEVFVSENKSMTAANSERPIFIMALPYC